MFAIFLLALLADVARSHAPVAVGGDPASGMILSAATQLGVGPGDGAEFVRSRAAGVFPAAARFKSSGLRLSKWAGILGRQSLSSDSSSPILLAVLASGQDAGSGSRFVATHLSVFPALTIFEHTGSPAP
jgi:hypothetical protein